MAKSSWMTLAILICLALGSAPVQALVLATDDGQGNETRPFGFDEWDHVGTVNGLTGVYLGEGWVIASNHGGAGDLLLDGVLYPLFPGSQVQLSNPGGSLADVVMFQVFPYPASLPTLALQATQPLVGNLTIMVGFGASRGAATSWDPNAPETAPPPLNGWNWNSGNRAKRWGMNAVAGFTTGLFLGTAGVFTEYDENQVGLPEAQAAAGDSGGAIFVVDGSGTRLAGIIYAIAPTPGQPAGTALYTNLTVAARIEIYREEMQALIALPEPSGGLPIGAALLVFLARRRHEERRRTLSWVLQGS